MEELWTQRLLVAMGAGLSERVLDGVQQLALPSDAGLEAIELHLDDPVSVANAAEQVMATSGGYIYGLFNNGATGAQISVSGTQTNTGAILTARTNGVTAGLSLTNSAGSPPLSNLRRHHPALLLLRM